MNKFFEELDAMLKDKEQVRFTIAKTGDQLTVGFFVNGIAKCTASGTAQEIDEKLIPSLKESVQSGTFTFTVTDTKTSKSKDNDEEEEEEEEDDKQAEAQAFEDEGKDLLKKKDFVKAYEKFKASKEAAPVTIRTTKANLAAALKGVLALATKAESAGDKALKKKDNAEALKKFGEAIDLRNVIDQKSKALESKWSQLKPSGEEPAVATGPVIEYKEPSIHKKVPLVKNNEEIPVTRYSDAELDEFKVIVDERLKQAVGDLASMSVKGHDLIKDLNENEAAELRKKQEKFIENLQRAQERIVNKTYGICRATGKLISKERLKQVPHATLAIEAKLEEEPKKEEQPVQENNAVLDQLTNLVANHPGAGDDNKKTVFDFLMKEGGQLFSDRKYSEASAKYASALEIFPDDPTAKAEKEKADKWVKAVEEL